MTHSDQIADFLTRVRNASRAGHKYVDVCWSTVVENIAAVLKETNYIEHILVQKDVTKPRMRLFLRYVAQRESVIKGLKRISKPSRRQYVNSKQIPRVLSGLGLSVISTSQGVMSGQLAREKHIGGEVLCYVW